MDGRYSARGRGAEFVFHLHRFQHHEAVAFLDRLAGFDEHAEDEARHRRADLAFGRRGAVIEAEAFEEERRLVLDVEVEGMALHRDARGATRPWLDCEHVRPPVEDEEDGVIVEPLQPRLDGGTVEGEPVRGLVEVEGLVGVSDLERHGRACESRKDRPARLSVVPVIPDLPSVSAFLRLVEPLTPDLLLYAYGHGLFPMADPEEDGQIYWYAPDPRAILPLDAFHVPGSLARVVRQARFEIRVDTAFETVMRACAEPAPGRESTWISEELVDAYRWLHHRGHAHSVECWKDGDLVGGLYGVRLGGAFFGESMFHRVRDASKVALVHLVDRLRRGGFRLLDTQMATPHLERFGVIEISRVAYEARLAEVLPFEGDWHAIDRAGIGKRG